MHLHSYYRYPSNRDNHIIISITGDIITIVILYKRCKSFDYEIGVSLLFNIRSRFMHLSIIIQRADIIVYELQLFRISMKQKLG